MPMAKIGGNTICLGIRHLPEQARHFHKEYHAKWKQETQAENCPASLSLLAVCIPYAHPLIYCFKNFFKFFFERDRCQCAIEVVI